MPKNKSYSALCVRVHARVCLVLISRVWCLLWCGSGALAAEADVSLQTGDFLSEQPSEVALELLTHKCVKHRTNATIQVGNVPGHIKCIVQALWVSTLVILLTGAVDLDSLKEYDDIIGRPAGKEGENYYKYEPDGMALPLHAGGQDADGDADVAVHHHEQREEEEEQELSVISD